MHRFIENGALAGVVRQLQSLSNLATAVFDRLGEQLSSVHQRASDLTSRVNAIAYRTSQLADPDGVFH